MEKEIIHSSIQDSKTSTTSKEPFSWERSLELANLSQAVYEDFSSAKVDEKLDELGFTCLKKFHHQIGTQAILVKKENTLVLAFRGTETNGEELVRDIVTDLSLRPKDCRGVRFHGGFLSGYQAIEEEVIQSLDKHLKEGDSFYITGHSLGGALATVSSWSLSPTSKQLKACYTFGAPPVSVNSVNAPFMAPIYRIVNDLDFVPHSITVGKYLAEFSHLVCKVLSDDAAKIEKFTNFASNFEYCHSGEPFIMSKNKNEKISWKELLPIMLQYGFNELIINEAKPANLWLDHKIQNYIKSINGNIN